MKKHKKAVLALIGFCAIGGIALVVLVGSMVFRWMGPTNEEYEASIIHAYELSDGRILTVNNWDCGATCSSHTVVYLQVPDGKKMQKDYLFSCDHVSDIAFSDVDHASATISAMEGNTDGCGYNVGDTITY